MKRLAVLGSTGSIGTQTLDLVDRYPGRFEVMALVAGNNIERLVAQIDRYRPKFVSINDQVHGERIRSQFPGLTLGFGETGACEATQLPEVDLVVMGIVGFAALKPTLSAVQAGKTIALANKESLVVGGALLKAELSRSAAKILPVDSEHNAVYQLLEGVPRGDVASIVLTASGGPLLRRPDLPLNQVTPAIATKHPNWAMGPKISVDSATLMNKGLEVIEAHFLFDLPESAIEVWVHPQSVMHGALLLKDNSVIAHLSRPDMHGSIAYALTRPHRLESPVARLSFRELAALEFFEPDLKRFPCLALAKEALRSSSLHCVALNAANEVAVEAFLGEQIGFPAIANVVEWVLQNVKSGAPRDLEELFAFDAEFRRQAALSLPSNRK
ncbi:MAG: 1-deoxy-D-xylulose-5-phosphate reductoisomerase [Deltaproteobacteria bacterium]|nr:1-deoxy-D-xylulose-5-phosphate reductoisomerase [Deltaproteobacteria bacterium]MBI3293176.1 1-deoxy-D-xylulose-5-phosphate reductoisomerase [Deltaproteobacteria bacterium]